MCVKGVVTPEIANHPDRLRKRFVERERGAVDNGKVSPGMKFWEKSPLNWTNSAKRQALNPLPMGQGTGRHHYMHVVRFANALGTPNWYEPGLAQCFIPRITVSNLTYGGFVVGDYYGEVSPKCILFWGHNPLVSGPDGELSISVKKGAG